MLLCFFHHHWAIFRKVHLQTEPRECRTSLIKLSIKVWFVIARLRAAFFDGVSRSEFVLDLFTCDRVPCQSSCFNFVVALVAMVNRYQVDSLWANNQKKRETQRQLQKYWRNLTSRIRSTEKVSIECEKSTSAHNAHTTRRVSAEMMGKYLDKKYFCCEKQIVSVLKWNLLFARTNLCAVQSSSLACTGMSLFMTCET